MVVDLVQIETPDPPEDWLLRYDREPTVFPRWPRSKSMSVVAVRDADTPEDEEATEAYIVRTPAMLATLTHPNDSGVKAIFGDRENENFLFFTVPTSILERADVMRLSEP